jgi:hypothetical protein
MARGRAIAVRCDASPWAARVLLFALSTSVLLALTACSTGKLEPLEIETGPGADVTVDGLHRVSNPTLSMAWIKPGADFSRYTHVRLDPVHIAYRRTPDDGESPRGDNYALTREQTEAFRRIFRDAFVQQIGKLDALAFGDSNGPTTLRIGAAIIDLTIKIPELPGSGAAARYTSSTADMTLVMEIRDSQSGEILARVADRKLARSAGNDTTLSYSSAASNQLAIREIFDRWAEILAKRLSELRELASPVVAD